nr:PD40 domain-containing protein [Arenimonas sp.]
MRRFLSLLALALLLPAGLVRAQGLDIGLVTGNEAALPIAVVPMPYLGTSVAPDTDIAAVIRADLNRSGQFRALSEQDVIERPLRGSEIKFPTWRVLKQDFVVVGRVLDNADGGYRVEYELWDVAKQERLLGLAVGGRARGMRDVAHQIADQIYEKILGVRGAFWTRIAYVTANGVGSNIQYALMVADSDGFNPQTVVRSKEPLLSPAWSPDGRKLAYVSFERGNSTVYVQEITTGAREVLASFRGINGAPSFAPDGRRLALTLSRSGNPEIYVMDLASRGLTQITRH